MSKKVKKRKDWLCKEEVLQIVKRCLGLRFNTEAERFLEQIDVVVEVLSQVMEVDTVDKEKKAKLGSYILLTKTYNPSKQNYRMPNGEYVTVKPKLKLKAKITPEGEKLPEMDF